MTVGAAPDAGQFTVLTLLAELASAYAASAGVEPEPPQAASGSNKANEAHRSIESYLETMLTIAAPPSAAQTATVPARDRSQDRR